MDRQAFTPRELWEGKILPLSRATVYELLATNKLRSIRVGRKILIPADAIEEFLRTGAE